MRKVRLLFVLFLCALVHEAWAQEVVHLGDCSFVPEQNVNGVRVRSAQRGRDIDMGEVTGGKHNVLLQFASVPTAVEQARLEQRGVQLSGWVGGNAYWALVAEGTRPEAALAGSKARSVMGTQPEWKASGALLRGEVPEWAQRGNAHFAFVLHFAANASEQQVRSDLLKLGARSLAVDASLGFASGEMPIDQVRAVAALGYVQTVQPISPKYELHNAEGAALGGAARLRMLPSEGGRGLSGKGIRAGIWDGNVEQHPDFGDRVVRMEFETTGEGAEHGTHVAGTMLGAGLQDIRGRGMAPELRAWTYNFGKQSNGLTPMQEMKNAVETQGITLSQHSYGYTLQPKFYKMYVYLEEFAQTDQLTYDNPTFVQVYSTGNDQERGGAVTEAEHGDARFGTTTKRAKNVIHVGAVDAQGDMTVFSSCGPMDDGRMIPTICAKGEQVYSTKPGGGYQTKDGTSMACPTASGHIALIQERYRQINSGADIRVDELMAVLATSATDAGNKGPDYMYGFGVLNAERALDVLESNCTHTGSFAASATEPQTFTVRVPNGAKSVRVTLAWIDPVVFKEYSYGESPLINDLDLRVTDGKGREYKPMVCNPRKAARPAVEGEDHVNNVEQVVIEDLDGQSGRDVTIKVLPHQVAMGQQQYYVAYWFDMGELEVLSPRNGDVVLPGGSFYLRLAGVDQPYAVEYSSDGGASYNRVLQLDKFDATKAHYKNLSVSLASDAKITERAKVRVITKDGRVAESKGYFSVIPQVMGLTVNSVGCGNEGFKLQWMAAEQAEKGYVVLRLHRGEKQYSKVAEVAAGVTEYSIKADQLRAGDLFTVACRMGEETWGPRAVAVMPRVREMVTVKQEALPWRENFMETPTRYFTADVQKPNSETYMSALYPSMPLGCHTYSTTVGATNDEFDVNDPFAAGHAKNTIKYDFCGLDLRNIPAGEEVMLHLRVGMAWMPINADRGPWFRVLMDGKPIADAAGVEVHERLPQAIDLYYRISGGAVHDLSMQFVGKYAHDRLLMHEIAVESVKEGKDVGLTIIKLPDDGAELGAQETVRVQLYNAYATPQPKVDIVLLRNGVEVCKRVEQDLRSYERRAVELPIDLRSKNMLGETFDIEVRAQLEGDVALENNVVRGTVVNGGKVFAMRKGTILYTPFVDIVADPKQVYRLKEGERLIFTDNGGALGDYYFPQASTLKVLPSGPGRMVRVRFNEFSSDREGAALFVINATVPEDLKTSDVSYDRALRGSDVLPYGTVSGATDGALTFYFEAHRGGSGWIAEIDEVPLQNALTLVSAQAQEVGTSEKGEVTVKVRVRNNFEKKVERINLHYYLDDKTEDELLGESLAAKEEKEFVFSRKVKAGVGQDAEVSVWLECEEDTDGTDNTAEVPVLYDVYPIPSALAEASTPWFSQLQYVGQVATFPKVDTLAANRQHLIQYNWKDTIQVYKGLEDEPVDIIGLKGEVGDAVRLWVDWNDDRTFGADELAGAFEIEAGIDLAAARISKLVGLDGASAGVRRARVAVGNRDELSDAAFAVGLMRGSVRDFMVKVHEGGYPHDGDLELSKLILQTTDGKALASGTNLPKNGKIVLEVKNLGHDSFDGKFKAIVDVDGVATTEEVDLKARGYAAIAPYGRKSGTIPLNYVLDVSGVGKHEVKVTIEEEPAVVGLENNVQKDSVYSQGPKDGSYALAFKSRNGAFRESATLGGRYQGKNKQATIEFWAYIDKPQYGVFLESPENFVVCTFNNMKADYPNESLALAFGNGLFCTKAHTFPAGRWTHVAVVVDEIEWGGIATAGACKVSIYIDGKPQEVTAIQMGAGKSFSSGMVGTYLNGMVTELRLWETARTQESIRNNMYRHVQDEARDGLVYEYRFSEGEGNKYTYGVNAAGGMESGMLNEVSKGRLEQEGALWYDLRKQAQYVSAQFDGQVKIDADAGGVQKVLFRKGQDLSAVKSHFVTAWPNTVIREEGKEVTADTQFDMTGGKRHELTFTSDVFGIKVAQTVTFVGVEDASDACEIRSLELLASENMGLGDDVRVAQPAQSVVLEAKGAPSKPNETIVRYEAAEGAKVTYNGKAIQSPATLDFTKPILLTVTAENERDEKVYSLRMAVERSISWDLADATYEYGAPSVAIAVTGVSDEAALEVRSNNPDVASIADRKLRIGMPGETTVSLRASASGIYKETEWLRCKVTVSKKALRVKPVIANVEYGKPIGWRFEEEGLVSTADGYELGDVKTLLDYGLYNAAGDRVEEGEALVAGGYTVKPGKQNVETEKYVLTGASQDMTVEKGTAKALEFAVKEGAGNAVADAEVRVGERRRVSDSRGACALSVAPGVYTYEVRKAGYQVVLGTVEVKADDVKVPVTLAPAKYTLSYKVKGGEGGTIYGMVDQQVSEGGDGEAVEALADAGYRFVSWSDGKGGAVRRELGVKANVTAEAVFAKEVDVPVYTITYHIEGAGEFSDGGVEDKVFEVRAGDPLPEISLGTALKGNYFVSWSDGVLTPFRPKGDVAKGDMKLVAKFAKYATLPLKENFEAGEFGENWLVTATYPDPRYHWKVYKGLISAVETLTPSYSAVIDCGDNLENDPTEYGSALRLPQVDVEGIANDVKIAFDWSFYWWYSELSLEYSIDGGPAERLWVRGKGVENPDVKRVELTIPAARLKGKSSLALTFHYRSIQSSFYALIDNLEIYEAENAESTVRFTSEPAGQAVFRVDGKPVTELLVKRGGSLPAVKVEPKAPYRFVGWKVNGESVDLEQYGKVLQDVTLTAILEDESQMTIAYVVVPSGAGEIQLDGKAVGRQIVTKGSDAKEVVAMPNRGYTFAYWGDNGDINANRIDKEVKENRSIVAVFKESQVAVEFSVKSAGGATVPLEGVRIMLRDADGTPTLLTTDQAGNAKTMLRGGNYSYIVEVKGYNPVEKAVFTVAAGMAVEMVELHKEGAEYPLEVLVTDAESNEPLDGAAVKIGGTTANSSSGVASFTLPKGRYYCFVVLSGYKSMEGVAVNVPSKNNRLRVSLQKDVAAHRVTFVVTDAMGGKVEGASVAVGAMHAVTNADGKVQLTLSEGDRNYVVSKLGYSVKTGSVTVSATSGEVNVQLELQKYLVSVVVKDVANQPIKGANVTFNGKQVMTEDDGKAAFGEIPSGKYEYRVEKAPYAVKSGEVYVKGEAKRVDVVLEAKKLGVTFVATSDGQPIFTRAKLVLTAEANGAEYGPSYANGDGKVECVLLPGKYRYTLMAPGYKTESGNVEVPTQGEVAVEMTPEPVKFGVRVVDKDQKGVENAAVSLVAAKAGAAPLEMKANAAGEAEFDVWVGEYTMTIRHPLYNRATKSVKVSDVGQREDVVLSNEVTVLFVVKYATKTPAEGATVSVKNHASRKTNAEGKATFSLTKGERIEYSVTPPPAAKDYAPIVGVTYQVNDESLIDITLPALGDVTFTVVGVDGKPLKNVLVTQVDGRKQKRTTEGDGVAEFSDAQGVEYHFDFELSGYEPIKNYASKLDKEKCIETIILRKPYVLTCNEPAHGILSITCEGETMVHNAKILEGKVLTIEAIADAGYRVETLEVNGKPFENGQTVEVSGNVNVSVSFKEVHYYVVTFVVKDESGRAVNGAAVEANGQKVKSESGMVELKLADGEYDYKVTKEGYEVFSGKVTVEGADRTENVTLEKKPNAVESELLAGVQVKPNPFVGELRAEGVAQLRELQVYTADGLLVATYVHKGTASMVLRTGEWNAGVYVLRMVDVEGGVAHRQVVKQE